jgi:hypothetical protein
MRMSANSAAKTPQMSQLATVANVFQASEVVVFSMTRTG